MSSILTADNLVNALSLGALYALIAVGYTMVYGIIKLINFAHGEIFMLGAFWALLITGMEEATGYSLFVAIVPAIILCAGVGMAIDWGAYLSLRRRLPVADGISVAMLAGLSCLAIMYRLTGDVDHEWYSLQWRTVWGWGIVAVVGAMMLLSALEKFGWLGVSSETVKSDRLSALITAIGMSLMLQTLVQLIWGADYRVFKPESIPGFMTENVLGIESLKWKEAIIWIVALVMMLGLHVLVTRTKIGTAMRATSMDQQTAALMGISVDKVIAFTFLVGSGMAAVAGVLYAAKVDGNISFRMGYYPGLLAFAAAVLGGIGNIRGAMLGGVLIGFVQGFTGGTFSAPFLVMIIVLLFLPRGILGEPDAGRA